MTGVIFVIQNDQLVELKEQQPASEDIFQSRLAKYPGLLAGEQMNVEAPRRWLLISREMGIPDEDAGGARWALDHLFLDQDGVPTLVEVKLAGNSRARREVVAQMLDYAANAVVFWSVEKIRTQFDSWCTAAGLEPEAELKTFLGDNADAAETFWSHVKTNLQAGKIRMIFVADLIGPELRRIVEFLNQQMDPAEVLAVEIRHYGADGLDILVSYVIGQTAAAKGKKAAGVRPKRSRDEASFFADAGRRCEQMVLTRVRRIYDWGGAHCDEPVWGKGKKISFYLRPKDTRTTIGYVESDGSVWFQIEELRKLPPFEDDAMRRALVARLNQVFRRPIPEKYIHKKQVKRELQDLKGEDALEKLLETLKWVLEEIAQRQQIIRS
jgi:hypothetical protein